MERPPERLDDVVDLVREVLGPEVIGVYPHGSAVLGGLRPHSDLDVFVVLRRHTRKEQRRALVDGLLGISGDGTASRPARPVELTAVVRDDVCPWRMPPRCEFQYGEWLREEYERGLTPSPGPDPDLAPLVTMVLRGDTALYGPPPGEVLAPVPHGDLRRGIVAGVPGLSAEVASDTRNVVLTLARVWTTLATGTVRSKDAAADWALPRLPAAHRPVLAHARAVYLGDEEERWEEFAAGPRPYVDHVVREIDRLEPLGGTARRR
ncbi:DUF4111 domain-containing protein [Streptomyces sp. TRM43335]|uniref:DUF4111 domain-containing protein n=1 Tax=Streptomyces taklimakanensis TaxID=2569853 RepID=A0A6G2BJJ3_9ACTN|nr:aminoglycoside adenylyltransferase family protein [Streptomyces taklimakanensis]MTE22286.1 DUF4111 domain-containing protein [Streptomyces taklimakanensis]